MVIRPVFNFIPHLNLLVSALRCCYFLHYPHCFQCYYRFQCIIFVITIVVVIRWFFYVWWLLLIWRLLLVRWLFFRLLILDFRNLDVCGLFITSRTILIADRNNCYGIRFTRLDTTYFDTI